MELLKTEHSNNKGTGKLDKVLIKCDEPDYYKLIEFLYASYDENAIVLKALNYLNINVVLKFGMLQSIEKEFSISNELLEMPNFMKYFCILKCYDDIKNILLNKNTISKYKICHYGNNQVGILVMKHYYLGSIENYDWNENNFELLKNVIKQTIYAVAFAYEKKGFIHGDLHSGNVLLKPKRNPEISYGDRTLIIDELEA